MMNANQLPDLFQRALAGAGMGEAVIGAPDIDGMPELTGAYALILRLNELAALRRPAGANSPLAPGWYLYAGSARGPGGIRARVRRHFRMDKTVHWHIDQLTGRQGVQLWACPLPGGHECDLVERLNNAGSFRFSCPGFGSSDCSRCKGHLLLWDERSAA